MLGLYQNPWCSLLVTASLQLLSVYICGPVCFLSKGPKGHPHPVTSSQVMISTVMLFPDHVMLTGLIGETRMAGGTTQPDRVLRDTLGLPYLQLPRLSTCYKKAPSGENLPLEDPLLHSVVFQR